MGSQVINVLDLPRLREEPSFEEMLAVLTSLEVKPLSWSDQASATSEDIPGLSSYLTSILKNSFEWLDDSVDPDGEKKEVLWDLASKRISERCGRSAMGEMSRTWVVPASESHPDLNIEIREPPLTGDNLGFKTWGTAWAIAQELESIGKEHFQHLHPSRNNAPANTSDNTSQQIPTRVLEFGAGTGLLGLAAAAVWRTNVIMTDLPLFQDNLLHNIDKNSIMLENQGAVVSCDILDWTEPENGLTTCSDKEFEIIMASDPLYDESHPGMVAAMINLHLKRGPASRAMVAVPLRDEKTRGFSMSLRKSMADYEFDLLYEGTVICRDDWVSTGEEVRSWYGIWGMKS
ncbi:Protein-lysine N-methyltransferase EFM2 [Lachnellula suecica]|uniref:Protein-lysine N-methyltransferase EFM2 n=1 Tax=Lachnellula suecica TaxID=602035 RepID=A0A8T9BVX0_9HELO|nr:Protein-lysine N-methyltransferase EFM2 [Lachnellula suecica]